VHISKKEFIDSLVATLGAFAAFITGGLAINIPLGKFLSRKK
jgi:hypothetical protein